MHNLLGLVKWLLILFMVLLWLGLSLANRGGGANLVVIPGAVEFDKVPMVLILIGPLVVLFLIFWVVGLIDQVDSFLQARELKKRISELEQEVRQLRNLPIREGLRTERTLEEENA